jgi:hypothetical protein
LLTEASIVKIAKEYGYEIEFQIETGGS